MAQRSVPVGCHPSDETANIWRQVFDIGYAYQRALSPTPVYVTGSIPVNRIAAPREWMKPPDKDLLLVDIKTADELKCLMSKAQATCRALGGKYHDFSYLSPESGEPGMRYVLAKGACDMPKGSIVPKVSVVFSKASLQTHLEEAKPPSVVAYPAGEPQNFITLNNRWPRYLRKRQMPPGCLDNLKEEEIDNLQFKWGHRGIPIHNSFIPPPGTVEHIEKGKTHSTRGRKRLLKLIQKRERAEWITAKVHFSEAATWRNLRIAQGGLCAMAGVYAAWRMPSTHRFSSMVRLPLAFVSITAGGWVAERRSPHADAHQAAGGAYKDLEHQWSFLQACLLGRRVSLTWADAYAYNLLRQKAKLDKSSPTVSEWLWKGRAVLEQRLNAYKNPFVDALLLDSLRTPTKIV